MVLLIVASIVEASNVGKMRKKRGKKKGKGKKPALTTLHDAPGSGGETPVGRNSGPSLESGKAKDNKASVKMAPSTVEGNRSEVVPLAVSGSSTKREDVLGKKFWKAVDGEDFGWLGVDAERWRNRRDLFDNLIRGGPDATAKLIQNLKLQECIYLLHSLIRGKKG